MIMAMFIGIHEFPEGITDEDVQKSWEAYKASALKTGIKALNAVSNSKKRKAFCYTEADSEEQVRKAHADAHVEVKDVIEVAQLK